MKFMGLNELVNALPKGAYVMGRDPGYSYTWDETAKRWIGAKQEGKGEAWLVLPDGTREKLGE